MANHTAMAISDGLTFDDLLIQPAYSQIVPSEVRCPPD